MKNLVHENVVNRIIWLYGLHMLISNLFIVIGFYFIPEGFFKGTPLLWAGNIAAKPESFAGELLLTLFFNIGIMAVIGIGLNLISIRGFPQGYFVPMVLGVVAGLLQGTNSFVALDLDQWAYREGYAIGLTIGSLEMLGYICIVASTARIGIFNYQSWWRINEKPVKVMRFRDVRLSLAEVICLLSGALLIVAAAFRESAGV